MIKAKEVLVFLGMNIEERGMIVEAKDCSLCIPSLNVFYPTVFFQQS